MATKYVGELFRGERKDRRWRVNGQQVDIKVVSKNPFRMVPFLITINEAIVRRQRELREAQLECPYGLRTFPIIAQKSWSRQHIRYDCDTIVLLKNRQINQINVGRAKRGEERIPRVTRAADFQQTFRELFRLEKFEKGDVLDRRLRFALSINTDGTSASILMRKVVTPRAENIEEVVERRALDPGRKLMHGSVSHDEKNPKIRENLVLKSSTYHHNAGYYARKRKREAITSAFETRTRDEREERQRQAEEDGEVYDQRRDLIEHERGYFQEKVALYMSNKYTRLKLDKYIQSRKTLDRHVAQFSKRTHKQGRGRTVVYYGDGCEGKAVIRK